jgi:hypothetical protein
MHAQPDSTGHDPFAKQNPHHGGVALSRILSMVVRSERWHNESSGGKVSPLRGLRYGANSRPTGL